MLLIPPSSMDPSKKRKPDENGTAVLGGGDIDPPPGLTPEDVRRIIESFTQDQFIDILQTASVRHRDVLDAVRAIADRDPAQRKLFIRGLGFETTTERLRSVFSSYGELEEAIVIVDKASGKSRGYGFVTFKHIDGALLALKEPSKQIDGRMTVTQLAAAGVSGPTANNTALGGGDVSKRKIYVGSVPVDLSSERLLGHFAAYGEIEEGPLGFDKQTGKSRGFAFFVYKTEEGAMASLVDPMKNIDGHQVVCKLAVDNKKGKTGASAPAATNVAVGGFQGPPGNGVGDRIGMPPPSSMPGSQYNVPGGLSSYGGFSGGQQGPHALPHLNQIGNQLPSSMSGSGGYGSGLGGAYGGSQYGGPASGEYGGLNNAGSSSYRMPPSSAGMPSGGYPDGGHYGLSSSAFPTQHHQPSPVPRVPPGGMYQNMPPYY
ncbi:hypothetical protein L1049_010509 [Liquidambar formosana]|uniref:RRM domain-containing protein n=1 Tax=Liquidambar formosana TaxID=63359 RepID=A0AAP0NAD7_LIQFO